MSEQTTESSTQRSWIERLTHALTGEPQDKGDLVEILRDASNRELIDGNALGMIEGVLDVQDQRVEDIMIPRSQMVIVENNMSLETILDVVVSSGHSRFPVIGENKDEVLGILLAKDLLAYVFEDAKKSFILKDILRNAVFIPESKRLDVLLQEFKEKRYHMAIVVDEYGGVTGLVTIEDVLEQIVGDITDEYDLIDAPGIRQFGAQKFTVKALTTIEEFNEFFNTSLDDTEVETIGGLITRSLGHLPKRGESIDIEQFRFTIMRADNRRIHSVQAIRLNDDDQEV